MILLHACSKVDQAGEICDDDDDGYVEDVCASRTDYPAGDCDDANAAIHPGASEVCNGADDDCDGVSEDAEAEDRATWYRDNDADGAGDPANTLLTCASDPVGYVATGDDCDDADVDVQQHTFYADVDDDEHGDSAVTTLACVAPDGFVDVADDCDDTDRKVSPEESEVCENGLDDDCDGAATGCGLYGEVPVAAADAVVRGGTAGEGFGWEVLGVADLDADGALDMFSQRSIAWGPLTGNRDSLLLTHSDFGSDPTNNAVVWNGEFVVALFYGTHPLRSYTFDGRTLAPGTVSIDGRLGEALGVLRGGLVASDFRNSKTVYWFADPASATAEADAEVRITNDSSLFGSDLGVGDLDADGLEDLVVTSFQEREVNVWFDLPTGIGPSNESRDVVLSTVELPFGSLVGDLDGDGSGELFVPIPTGGAGGGEVRGVSVTRATPSIDLDAAYEWRFVGEVGSPIGLRTMLLELESGPALVSAGTAAGRGRVAVFAGSLVPATYAIDAARAIVVGADVDSFGSTLADLGDIDGDGFADVAIGAGRAAPNGTDSGAAYVFLGSGL